MSRGQGIGYDRSYDPNPAIRYSNCLIDDARQCLFSLYRELIPLSPQDPGTTQAFSCNVCNHGIGCVIYGIYGSR